MMILIIEEIIQIHSKLILKTGGLDGNKRICVSYVDDLKAE